MNEFFRREKGIGLEHRVSPVRRPRGRKRWTGRSGRTILVAAALLGGAVIAHAGWSFMKSDGAFGVRQIHVMGLVTHDPQALRDALVDLRGRNLFTLGPEEISRRLSSFPWLKGFLFRKHLPDTLIVEVAERRGLCTVSTDRGPYTIDGDQTAWPALSGTPCAIALCAGLDPADPVVQRVVSQAFLIEPAGSITSVAKAIGPGALFLECEGGWRLRVAPEDVLSQWHRFQEAKAWAEAFAPKCKTLDLRWSGRVVLLPETQPTAGDGIQPANGVDPASPEGGAVHG